MKKLLCSSLTAWALAAFLLPGSARAFTLATPCCMPVVVPSTYTATCIAITNQQVCNSFGVYTAASPKRCKWNPACGANKCCIIPGTVSPCPIPNATPDTCKAAQCAWSPKPECSGKAGPCCKPKPGGTGDCSLPIMNLGHPQDVNNPLGHTFGKARCEGVNYGCAWDQTNPECRILPPNPCPPPYFSISQSDGKYCCQKNTPNAFCCRKLEGPKP